MKTYIYARSATKSQTSDSRDTVWWQVNRCQQHAYRMHLDTPKVEIEQSSGGSVSPKLQRLLNTMQSGDRLIVDSPSRLSKDMSGFIQVKMSLASKGCRLEFARNNLGVELQLA